MKFKASSLNDPSRTHGTVKGRLSEDNAEIRRIWRARLLLCFLEHHVLSELLRVLLELDLSGDELLVLSRPIDLSGLFVTNLNESFL